MRENWNHLSEIAQLGSGREEDRARVSWCCAENGENKFAQTQKKQPPETNKQAPEAASLLCELYSNL